MACMQNTELWKETNKVYDHWVKSKSIERWGLTEDKSAFKMIFETATDKPFVEGADVTPMDMKKMLVEVQRFEKSLTQPGLLSNKFFKAMYVGRRKAAKNIILQRFYDDIINANEYRNRNTQNMMSDYNNMIKDAKNAIYEYHGVNTTELAKGWDWVFSPTKVMSSIKARKVQKTWDKLNELEKNYVIANHAGKSSTQQFGDLQKFLKNEGTIFADIVQKIESGSDQFLRERYKTNDNRVDPSKMGYIKAINNLSSNWRSIEVQSRKELTNSIANLVEVINLKYGNNSKKAQFLVNEYKEISELINQQGEGYMPHFVLNLFETGMGLAEKISEIAPENRTQLDKVMADYTSRVSEIKIGLSDRLKKKSKTPDEYFSRNPMLYAAKYVEQVARFNHRTHIDKAFTHGLKDITKVLFRNPDTAEFNAATTYKRVLEDMYVKATGQKTVAESPVADNMVRFITSLQFTSKLGFSTRGAGRNYFQRLWNLQWFGGNAVMDARKALGENNNYKNAMEHELNRHGLAFIDIANMTEGALTATDMIASHVNMEKGSITYREGKTVLEKATELGVKIADKSSYLTKLVENGNRKSTFKVAFHKRVEELKRTDQFSDWNSSKEVQDHMYRLAGNYAAKMTSLIHFEYSKSGKAEFLTNKTGMVAGQFMHYAMSLADLQAKMIGDYTRAFKAGDYTGKELGRIVKTGTTIALSNALSALFDINFTSYVNNDTVERLTGFANLMFGDEEQQKSAFYGKGLVGASGVVVLNDMVELYNIGAAYGLYKQALDPDSNAAWLTGITEYDPMSGKEAAGAVFSLLSIQGGRFFRQTFPALGYKNPLQSVIRAELGLWGGKTGMGIDTRASREEIEQSDAFKWVFDKKPEPAGELFKGFPSPKKKQKGFGNKNKKISENTQTRGQGNAEALKALDLLA